MAQWLNGSICTILFEKKFRVLKMDLLLIINVIVYNSLVTKVDKKRIYFLEIHKSCIKAPTPIV